MKNFFMNFKRKIYLSVANYFKFWANFSFKRWHPRVIMITGSAGKTTMLNLLETQLGAKAHYSHDANSVYGVAFDVLGMHGITGTHLHWITLFLSAPFRAFNYRHHEEFYVVEVDAARPHVAEWIAKWLRPEVSVWVSLSRSHAIFFEKEVAKGNFKDVDDAIAYEFATVPNNTRKLVIIDGDDAEIARRCKDLDAKVIAMHKDALKSYEVYPDHSAFQINKHKFLFNDPMPREVYIQLAMIEELMKYLKLPLRVKLDNYRMPPSRNNFFEGKKGVKLIDSSYNAHLNSTKSVLDMTREMKYPCKWIVVGDILDQGENESECHKELAQIIKDAKADRVILVGPRCFKYTRPALKELGIKATAFRRTKDALPYLEAKLTGKEAVVFKGSQHLEWLVEKLLANPEDAEKLCRREKVNRAHRAGMGLE